eukprot:scaffold9401_cov31-Tisochrysis_lutea.AAC.2
MTVSGSTLMKLRGHGRVVERYWALMRQRRAELALLSSVAAPDRTSIVACGLHSMLGELTIVLKDPSCARLHRLSIYLLEHQTWPTLWCVPTSPRAFQRIRGASDPERPQGNADRGMRRNGARGTQPSHGCQEQSMCRCAGRLLYQQRSRLGCRKSFRSPLPVPLTPSPHGLNGVSSDARLTVVSGRVSSRSVVRKRSAPRLSCHRIVEHGGGKHHMPPVEVGQHSGLEAADTMRSRHGAAMNAVSLE